MQFPMNTLQAPPSVQDRFNAVLMSTALANQLIGKRSPGEVTYEESEQGDARRRFLHVEKLAFKQKASDAQAHAAKVKATSDVLHQRLVERLKPLFTNGHTITTSILGFTDDVTQLLDTLSTRACSVSKLEPIISGLPWLHDALIKAVNSSEYRRIDSKGRVIIVETIRTALSAMGIENLRILMPFYIFRQGTPQITDPFPQIKTKLAEYHTATANGMMRLAKLLNMNVFEAYTMGFFSGLGKCAVIRQYFREYDRALQAYGKELMKQGDFETYKALQLVQPSASDVISVCDQFADEITTRMLEYMLFKRIRLLQPWIDADSPMRNALNISSEYAKLKVLLRYRLIDKVDAKDYLHSLRIDRAALTELNKPEIFRLAVDHTQTHVDK